MTARRTAEQQIEDLKVRLQRLEARKAQADKRTLLRLKIRLGDLVIQAGMGDWTDAQLGRAFAAAVKAQDAPKTAAPVASAKVSDAPMGKPSAPVVAIAKPAAAAVVKP
jgi:hypothetical protein